MVRRQERKPRTRHGQTEHLQAARVVDVVEVQNREEAWIGAPPLEIAADVHAPQLSAQQDRGQTAHPLVEVAQHDFGTADVAVADDLGQALSLIPSLENGGAEVDVVDVQSMSVDVDIGPLQAARLARLPGQIVFDVMEDRQSAQHDVAELVFAQSASRCHDPTHPQRRADLFDVATAARPWTDHFLQRDDVGVDGAQDRSDPIWAGPAIHPTTTVNVVGDHPQRGRVMSTHWGYDRPGRLGQPGGPGRPGGAGKDHMTRLKSEIEVQCPCCKATLVVDVNLGRVVSHAEPERGDKPELSDAQRILAEEARRREAIFQQSVDAEKNRGDALSRRFEEALKQARQEPITKPTRDFDLD